MYKRLVEDALGCGALAVRELATFTDEALLHTLETRMPSQLLDGLRHRQLYKRAFECPAAELPEDMGEWIASDRERALAAEDALARELGFAPGELLLDYPEKTQMLGLDMPVVRRGGVVQRLTASGLAGAINLPVMAEQLYRSARWLRVFTVRRVAIPRERVLRVVSGDG